MRTCPFHGCDKQIPAYLFACRTHWFQIPLNDRWRVNDAYTAYKRDDLDIEELREVQQAVLGTKGTA